MSGRKILPAAAGVFAAAVIICCGIVFAIFDESKTTHVKEEEIENSTLIIGTHLIHISALSDSLYDIAMDTAQLSGQYEMYYKSELADGKWFEISEAAGISDIMSEEKAVDGSVIESLDLRYHTKADGITYDLMTGEKVCIFDIISPYSLDTLPELEAVSVYHRLLQEKEKKTDTDSRNMELIEKAISQDLAAKLKLEDTDKKIEAFQKYYEEAARLDKGTEDTALSLMEGLDGARRLEVYGNLYYETLPELLNDVQTDSDDTDGFYVDYDLVSAIGTAMQEVEKKLTGFEANALEEGETTISKMKYRMMEQAAELIEANANTTALDSLMENIEDITNIENGTIKNPERQAALIRDKLIPQTLENLADRENGSDDADVSDSVWEIEYLAKTAVSGMSNGESAEFIEEVLYGLDMLGDKQSSGMQKSIEILKNSLYEIKGELSSDTSKLAELLDKKEQLKTKRQSSLDVNDLTNAEKIGLEIDAINEEIEKEELRLTDIINSKTAGDAEKANARAALEAGTATDSIIKTKESIQRAIADGMYDDAMTGLEAMEAFMEINLPMALSCMSDIYDDVLKNLYLEENKDNGLKEIKEALENIISDNYETIENGLSEETLLSILENIMGAGFKDCDDRQKICVAYALYSYGNETADDDVKTYAANLISGLYSEGNPYIYLKLKNEPRQFISLKAFSECSEYRYVFDNGSKSVTLKKGAVYYTYTVFKNQAVLNEGTEEMDTYARYQSDIYLSYAYMEEKFDVGCIYVDNTDYAVLITQDIEQEAAGLLEGIYSRAN